LSVAGEPGASAGVSPRMHDPARHSRSRLDSCRIARPTRRHKADQSKG